MSAYQTPMLEFSTNKEDIKSDLLDEIKLFFPYFEDCDFKVRHFCDENATLSGTEIKNTVCIDENSYNYAKTIEKNLSETAYKRLFKRECKLSVYRAFSSFTGLKPPWGSLTGIRPSKLVYDMLEEGLSLEECRQQLSERFFVKNEKSALICDIVKNQQGYYKKDDNLFNIYIHIPFCTSKCKYCSFTTETVSRASGLIPEYVKRLKEEISDAVDTVFSYGKLCSVYVGGGTPTALSAEDLYYLLSDFPFRDVEFTVEAGRPDTITEEKLDAIKQVGASRICVNPQTLNDKTLKEIGRSHTSEDFYLKFALARRYDFDVNVDLIAGLNGETIDDFKFSLDKIAELIPENVTVHTLSRKNGSELKQEGRYFNSDIELMTEYAFDKLTDKGYIPYYLYRQKQMLGNLENVGYCLKGKQCVNNVTTMEECLSVIACGAGSISKAVSSREKRIVRFADLRDVKLYLDRFDEKLAEKRNFFQKQFTKA